MAVGLETPLRGRVAKHEALEADLGLHTIGDLLRHLPRAYLDVGEVSRLGELTEGGLVSLVAEIVEASQHPYQDRKTGRWAFRTAAVARLEDGEVHLTWFDKRRHLADWRVSSLPPGRQVLVSGRAVWKTFRGRGRWELAHPHVADDEGPEERTGLWVVYPLSGKLRSEQIQRAVTVALDLVEDVPETIPDWLREEQGLVDASTALRWVHRPADRGQVQAALARLRFEEALVAQVALARRRAERHRVPAVPRPGRGGGLFDCFASRMPFELTAGQRSVEKELLEDLLGPHPMHRLLQGEVGSGKTVLAVRAMLRVVDSGGQAALLAPTEVLAQQHHRSISALLGDLGRGGELGAHEQATRVALLTGSMAAAARRRVLAEAASGEAGIVVGTHALLEDQVQFADLGLVVVDEQHRFGVEQRAALTEKSRDHPPHLLVMTATPIPRTVAMTVFGDLDTSTLTELPSGREPIQTVVVPLAEQPAWRDRVWDRVREEVEAGRQVYVVCPQITPTTEGEPGGAAVEEIAPFLADGPLAGVRLAVLHGRQPSETKDQTMRDFAEGHLDVLVCTSVVEVGLDVANATTMIVLDADRFGVSQLHQLRGRVGRGGHHGLCLLMPSLEYGTSARERLGAVAATTDGFRLAEVDLALRQEGDVLGSAQSGARRSLRLISVVRHADVIEAARDAALRVVERDPDLAGVPALASAVQVLVDSQRADYLDRA